MPGGPKSPNDSPSGVKRWRAEAQEALGGRIAVDEGDVAGRAVQQRRFTAREEELQQREETLQAEQEQFARQAADQRERMRALLSSALQGLEPVPAEPAPVPPADTAPEAVPDGGAAPEANEPPPET